MTSPFDLTGQRALVTGASKGIGEAISKTLAQMGATVCVHYNTDREGADRIVDEIVAAKGKAYRLRADLADWDAGLDLVAKAEAEAGPLDHVIINHGIWMEAAIDTMSEAQYDETMNANVRGAFSVASAAARSMKPRKSGHIVFIASTAGQRGEALHSHYAASKGALISLTKSLSSELAPGGIRVNCVAPGWVKTTMSEVALRDPILSAKVNATIPLGRVGSVDEIAGPVAFLCSRAAGFVTGEILNVNGGAVLVG